MAKLLVYLVFFVAGAVALKAKECPSDTTPGYVYYNTGNSEEGSAFEGNLATINDALIQQTPGSPVPVKVQAGDDPDTAYGYAACYLGNCEECLTTAEGYFHQIAPHALGARTCINSNSGSCFLRYENYAFFY